MCANQKILESDSPNFLLKFVTMAEMWTISLPKKQNNSQNNGNFLVQRKKTKIASSKERPGFSEMLMLDYLQKEQTINCTDYTPFLRQLLKKMKLNHNEKLSRGMLFHWDNALIHKFVIAVTAINNYGFQLIEHLHYLSDLAPQDFHLFPN